MKMKIKRNVIGTVVLVILALFFIMIAAFQIYESKTVNDNSDMIILGVGGSEGALNAKISGKPCAMGDCAALVSGGNFTVVDKNASIKTTGNFMLTDPILNAKGNYCIAADHGGKTARLYENGAVKQEVKCDGKIISAAVNESGVFAIASEEMGYDAVVTVYSKSEEAIYRYRISKDTFVDMDISANNRKIILTEACVEDGVLGSRVIIAEFNREGAETEFFVPLNVYISVHFNKNNSFVCLGDQGVDFYRSDSEKTGEVKFGQRRLTHGDIDTDSMVTLAFDGGENAPVGSSVLEIYDKNGKLKGSAAFEDEIEDISVNGKAIGVAHGNKADIIKQNGKIKKSMESLSPVKYAVPFKGGRSALIFSGGTASIVR